MAGENTATTLANGLRRLYSSDTAKLELSKNNPIWERMEKVNDFEGSTLDHTVPLAYGAGIGVTISDANAGKSADQYARFSVPRRFVYGVGGVSGELIRVTKTNRGSVIGQALQTGRDNQMEMLKLFIRHAMWGNGGGALSQVAAGSIAGSTLKVSDLGDLLWFQIGMKIHFSTDDGAQAAPAGIRAGIELTILFVNRDTGVITFDAAVPGAVQAGDYMFRRGTYGLVFGGIPLWIPRTAALASVALYGQPRSADPTRLSGLRYETAQGATVQECIFLALERAFREGIEPDVIALNSFDWITLPMVNQQQVHYANGGQKLNIGFSQSVTINAPYGPVEVVCDPGVKQGDGWLLTMSTWELHFAGKMFPELIDDDGNVIRADPNDDLFNWRAGGYGNFLCRSPRKNMYFKLPPRVTGL